MKIALNKAHYPVTVLGPGKRIGLWLQGCSIGCTGCVSQDTWAADETFDTTVETVLDWCRKVATQGLDGVTISGGEPFEQPEALGALLDGLQAWRSEATLDFDVLAYSGMPLRRLQRDHADLLARLDAIIPEPFVEKQPVTHVWRGSGNQPLLALSERGQVRYADWLGATAESQTKRMQIQVSDGRVWAIGIPARGDMQALEGLCASRGLPFASVSWRQ